MKFEFEEFESVEDIFVYLVTSAPLMKQVFRVESYNGYTFALIPVSLLGDGHMLMLYTKTKMEPGLLEFDISAQKYRKVSSVERADRNFFIVTAPKKNTLADQAINELKERQVL